MHVSPPITDRGAHVADYLRHVLDELSTRSLATWKRDPDLFLCSTDIKPTVLSLVVQILNQPLHMPIGNEQKWGRLRVTDCYISIQPDPPESANLHRHDCTSDNAQILLSTMMSRTDNLELIKCPEMVAYLTRLDQLEVIRLSINPGTSLDDNVYARLGDMIQRSDRLTELHLELRFDEVPLDMLERLSNAIHLKKLTLRKLRPRNCKERDIVSRNNIQWQGILELARQLPRIQLLQRINILPNPWLPDKRYCAQAEECVAGLTRGMMENYSVVDLEMGMNPDRSTLEEYPHASLLLHLLDINRAGRRIFAEKPSIPLELWPLVLERAGTTLSYPFRHKILTAETANANAVYFLLQNYPMFCHATNLISADEPMIE